jgi:hypothetical protein
VRRIFALAALGLLCAAQVRAESNTITVTHTQVASLGGGRAALGRWLFSAVKYAPAFEGEDYDGLIGQDVLRNFDLYFDYPQSKVFFVPNDRYRQRWGT